MEQIFSFGLRKIKEHIPDMILRQVFDDQQYRGIGMRTPITLDHQIESKVIRGGVVKDILSMGGRETRIPLGGVAIRFLPNLKLVVQIPMELTQGRNIIEVYRVNYFSNLSYMGYGGHNTYLDGGVMNLALNNIIDSHNPPPITSTSRCEVIAPNTLLVDLSGVVPAWMELEALLEKDGELSHILPASFGDFGQLCEYRAKMHIYNDQIIKIDEGRLSGGKELGVYKSIVDSYSDADKTYKDLLKLWKTVDIYNDREEIQKLIRLQIGNISI